MDLDIVEMRAIWNVLPKWNPDDPGQAPKAEWRAAFKLRLDKFARAEADGTLVPQDTRNPVYKVSTLSVNSFFAHDDSKFTFK